ncbi:GNAT family N-acetyltransferase [uncultured Methanobrevibacter sp.]|uniref:GNAT family N-acetyltransferase n=1 Tax=uncultured Methanobrevibacter sp. TaxID=253161 RepID=UPI002636CADB|nr:GNAT family N-acetyltransferase [uncultured Methanobrevibacter sp.]
MEYLIRDDNTQKVFLSEANLGVEEILEKNYPYILDSIRDEGIILKASECNLFKELVWDNKVVGFCSYDFSRQFITAALNNIYVIPEFRGNGLFLDELQKTMVEYNKPSIVEPTHLVIELLIKYGFAKRISDNIVASSIEFIVPGSHVISNASYEATEELSTHFYDISISACIHFLDIDKGIVAYSSPLNYDIVNYDCLEKRDSIDDAYFAEIREFFMENDVEIMRQITDLEDRLPVKSYTLEEVVGGDGEFSAYISSLIDDAHITAEKAHQIKQQMIEEYEAGMILNESLLIRLAYLFDENKKVSIKSHTDTCQYCSMPIDSHDRFCHFCGINLDYRPDEMLDSLIDTIDVAQDDFEEDIRYVAYKFLKLIDEGIEVQYAMLTIENTYNIDWDILNQYLTENGYFNGEITENGLEFLATHPLHFYEKYNLDLFNYTDFEEYFYRNNALKPKEIVLNYINQFESDEYILELKKEIEDN